MDKQLSLVAPLAPTNPPTPLMLVKLGLASQLSASNTLGMQSLPMVARLSWVDGVLE
jgi:hypothetical protein